MKRLPLLLLLALAASSIVRAAAEYPALGSDIYDPKSDGNAQIATALATAKTSHKNVLLMFGANWCVW